MPDNLADYYAQRAPEYDRVYLKRERQAELAALGETLRSAFAGRRVLEVACGTGHWTEIIAETAGSVLATDLNETMLAEARKKDFPRQNVRFAQHDLLDLPALGPFDDAFGGFIWSHLRHAELERMLDQVHAQLVPGSRVVWIDNRFVAGSNTPVAHTDAEGNTYQRRSLDDGSEFLILKNFPGEADFAAVLRGRVADFAVDWGEFYWRLHYTI